MRMIRSGVLLLLLGAIVWILARSVTVESSDDQVRIVIDRHRLRQAGGDLESKSRQAIGKVGQVLEHAGRSLDDDSDKPATLFHR